jgi:hypothetical protein
MPSVTKTLFLFLELSLKIQKIFQNIPNGWEGIMPGTVTHQTESLGIYKPQGGVHMEKGDKVEVRNTPPQPIRNPSQFVTTVPHSH